MRRAVVLVVAAALCVGACGPGAGSSADAPKDVNVTITRDFGNRLLRSVDSDELPPNETVMRLLLRKFDGVKTRYGGGFVQTLEGLSGGKDSQGRPVDWFYYVNGVEATDGAAAHKIQPGDRIWWDRHDWKATQHIPAVVGAWPEPFLHGVGGRRYPLTLACAGVTQACDEVQQRLENQGVDAVSRTSLHTANGLKTLRILVGPWSALKGEAAAAQLEKGPSVSGVYAIPHDTSFDFLDENGEVAETRAGSVGMVAATACCSQQPTWIVTGTDDAGVAAAAAGLRQDILHNRFAVALVNGRAVPLPVREDG
jgi:hypothetical protein